MESSSNTISIETMASLSDHLAYMVDIMAFKA